MIIIFPQIEIVVIDINDNTPTFTQARYEGDVSEIAEVGTSVLIVSATDQDNNSKLFYTIPMAVNVVSMRKLGINSKTGKFKFVHILYMNTFLKTLTQSYIVEVLLKGLGSLKLTP